MGEITDNRIIGWMKKGLLTDSESKFCESIYGKEDLTHGQWMEVRRLNRKCHPRMQKK